MANAILLEAGLSFLGLGVQPPTPSWGNMLTDAQSLTVLESMPWLWIPPGIAIALAVLAINFVGDGLRDALDPYILR
jgi:peptide/nickel transport system permease protein